MSYPEEEHEIHTYDTEHEYETETTEQPSRLTEKEFDQRVIIKKTKPEPCDYEMWLYTLVHYTEKNFGSSGYNKAMTDDCTRPFIVQRVFSSNMILLVVNSVCWEKENTMAKMPDPVEVDYNMSLACYRALFNNFTRRHYMSCINRNVNVSLLNILLDTAIFCFRKVKSSFVVTLQLLHYHRFFLFFYSSSGISFRFSKKPNLKNICDQLDFSHIFSCLFIIM